MKSSPFVLISLFCLFFSGCNLGSDEDSCATVLCAGPAQLAFEVQQGMENVFTNGSFSLQDLVLSGEIAADLEVQLATFNTASPNSILVVSNTNWMEGSSSFEFNFPGNEPVLIQVTIQNSEGECCGGIPLLQSLQIDGTVRELNGSPLIIGLTPNS